MLPGERSVEVWGKKIYISELLETIQKEQEEHYGRMKSTYDSIAKMFQEKTNDNPKEMSDKIKLEDMALAEIEEQKRILADAVRDAIARAVYDYHQKYDCGDVYVSADTDIIPPIETEQGEVLVPSRPFYDIRIKFSREDE